MNDTLQFAQSVASTIMINKQLSCVGIVILLFTQGILIFTTSRLRWFLWSVDVVLHINIQYTHFVVPFFTQCGMIRPRMVSIASGANSEPSQTWVMACFPACFESGGADLRVG